uniref:protein-serine/threonine phosphatase n=1 Tax=Zea mays TaxID=4577 RepID=A0A804NDR7_MAIZE
MPCLASSGVGLCQHAKPSCAAHRGSWCLVVVQDYKYRKECVRGRSGGAGRGITPPPVKSVARSGCTALSIVKHGDLMVVANVDDSRVVLGIATYDDAITPSSSSST